MKKYTAPELEIMEFELEDILTVSDGNAAGAKESWNAGGNNGWY